jgi:hypothetical protein
MSQPDRQPFEAIYANLLVIGHNAYEFLLDFRQSYSTDQPERSAARIVTGPVYAKEMMKTLQRSIVQYEAAHGAIPALEHEDCE